jgi:hypothetical protein
MSCPMNTTIGGTTFTLQTTERDGQWLARAARDDNGDPFGIECVGATEAEAIARLTRWLEWQHEHTAALEVLQHAQRAYHRATAGRAFANPTEGPTPVEAQQESLDAVDAARVRLDGIRARRPDL